MHVAHRLTLVLTLVLFSGAILNCQKIYHAGKDFFVAIPPNEINPYATVTLEIHIASEYAAKVEVYDYAADRQYRLQVKPFEVLRLSDLRELNWTMEVRDAEIPVKKGSPHYL
jgi:hypothetical protein